MSAAVKFTRVRVVGDPFRPRATTTWVLKPWAHAGDCECAPWHTFVCAHCGRVVGWCLGADDNMPDACDFCWRPEVA